MHLTGRKKRKEKKIQLQGFINGLIVFLSKLFLRHNLQKKRCTNNDGDANVDTSLTQHAKILEQSFQRRSITQNQCIYEYYDIIYGDAKNSVANKTHLKNQGAILYTSNYSPTLQH
jgi:hypothetical protein